MRGRAARPGELELTVLARRTEPRPEPRLIVLQAIPKGDRGELAVELLTEVGADMIVPWAAERCVAVWRGERAAKGVARWRSAAEQAAKQSRRAWFPEVTQQASRRPWPTGSARPAGDPARPGGAGCAATGRRPLPARRTAARSC